MWPSKWLICKLKTHVDPQNRQINYEYECSIAINATGYKTKTILEIYIYLLLEFGNTILCILQCNIM